MITVKPFRAARPQKGLEERVSCAPYDVMDTPKAKILAEGKKESFLHITRSEIDLSEGIDPYDQRVYDKAKENLDRFIAQGILEEESEKCYYLYREVMNGRSQNGIVACASIDDYQSQKIKRHEFTRVDKELDRINHFYTCSANTEPVFLFYKKNLELSQLVEQWMDNHDPVYDFVDEDDVRQMLWVVDSLETKDTIEKLFQGMDNLYIADGHHRTASSAKVGLRKREENPDFTGEEEFNFFMSVIFPEDELYIMPYNRVVEDLAGLSKEEFMKAVEEQFVVEPCDYFEEPGRKTTFTMVLGKDSYTLIPKEGSYPKDNPVRRLDVAILQNNLLHPILKIQDPRTDKRIRFYGGESMLKDIKKELEEHDGVAFLLYATGIGDITGVSDIGEVMPPKSTWFEPKLKSGLFIHRF